MADVAEILASLRSDRKFRRGITFWHTIPPRPAEYGEWPPGVPNALRAVLEQRGIRYPYSHQAEAIQRVENGKNVIVVTPTASGKTLCYNVPVLSRLHRDPDARALYLFPTKALSQDQMLDLHGLATDMGQPIKIYTFDGDTPASARRTIRSSGHIVVTNPDMLHTGILPHHTLWIRLFENLKFVVVDELHQYRGVFGSHMANLMRRLHRICKSYGAHPQFICCSATIANPKELAEQLFDRPFDLVDRNGAPQGGKHFIFYNPPVVNEELGIRRSVINEAARWATQFIRKGIQTIVFARSRLRVEILTTYLKRSMARLKKDPGRITGYRGGYLPLERREIEEGARSGRYLGVVSTNALELGIDIGQLQAAVLAGYPGTVSSTWQQGGRAGRRQETSVVVLVASSAPLDQFIVNNPRYFFGATMENGLVNPDNLAILMSHLKCGAFELPFENNERFGPDCQSFLRFLEEEHVVHQAGDRWHWSSEAYPAEEISLRSAAAQNFVIVNMSNDNQVIGEVDYFSAPMLIHEQAIYLHQSRPFVIERLDWEGRTAYAREVEVNYYTDAVAETDIKVNTVDREEEIPSVKSLPQTAAFRHFGDVAVSTLVPKYKKIKFETHENIGFGEIHLPQQNMQTESYWLDFSEGVVEVLRQKGLDLGGGLRALATALVNVVPIFVLCDPRDIRSSPMVRAPFSNLPTIYLWDAYPGGIGIARKIYEINGELFRSAVEVIAKCPCRTGCPSCVGPPLEVGDKGKESARGLLEYLL